MTKQQRKDQAAFEAARKSDVKYWLLKIEEAKAKLDLAQEHIERRGVNQELAGQIITLEEDRAYYKKRLEMAKKGHLLPFSEPKVVEKGRRVYLDNLQVAA